MFIRADAKDVKMSRKLVDLNEHQTKAVRHVWGACYVGACPGSGKCVTGDSIIVADDGFVEIQNPSVEWVRAFDKESLNRSQYRPMRISAFVDSGIQPTLKIQTEAGFSLEGTHHHPIGVLNDNCEIEWRELGSLKRGDIALIHMEKTHNNPVKRHPGFWNNWYAMGLMLGDGYLARKNEFSITTADDEIYESFRKTCIDYWDYNPSVYADKRRDNLRSLVVCSKAIKHDLSATFGDFAHLACEKILTPEMLAADRGEMTSLLRGLFDADGYVSGGNVEICLCSKKLISQLQVVLLRFGVFAVQRIKRVQEKDYYRLCISGASVRAFEKNVGFGLSRKTAQLASICDRTHNANRIIPHAEVLVRSIYSDLKMLRPSNYDGKLSRLISENGEYVRLVRYTSVSKAVRRGVTESAARNIVSGCRRAGLESQAVQQLRFLIDNFEFDQISTVDDGGLQQVYDYQIDGSHNFIANGFVSHNTRVIVERCARLIEEEIPPRSILCITFTNKAAEEMRLRLRTMIGEQAKELYISTFHALCAEILRKYGSEIGYSANITIVKEDDQESLVAQCARQLGFELKPQQVRSLIWNVNAAREKLFPVESQAFDNEFHSIPSGAAIAKDYLVRLKENNQIDFSGLLSETIRLLESKKHILQKLQDRFAMIQVDEAQDTNLAQFKIVQMLGAHTNVFMVGDLDQCQPGSTKVETTTGPICISDLDPSKDRLISFDRRSSIITGRKNGYAFKKSTRHYSGDMIRVEAQHYIAPQNYRAHVTSCTANHKWTVRLVDEIGDVHAVYLMRQDSKWRIGSCAMHKSYGKQGKTCFGVALRARQEKAEALWILSTSASACEARVMEQVYSCRYGIPMTCFESDISEYGYVSKVFEELGDLYNNAHRCLRDFGRDVRYPLWEKKIEGINQDFGKRVPLLVHACNLIPGLMQVPVPTKGKEFCWCDFTTSRSHWEGPVYSLDVERFEHYIADGIVTHNSIYGWRGARYENILEFIQNFRAEVIHLPVNYRSTQTIVGAAGKLIKCNKNRQEMDFQTTNETGEHISCFSFRDPDEEARWIAEEIRSLIDSGEYKASDFAILYRNNSMSRALEVAMMDAAIDYEVIGSFGFFDRKEIKDVLAMLRFLANPKDGLALARFINKPSRRIGQSTIAKIELFAKEHKIDLIQSMSRAKEYIKGGDSIKIQVECEKIAKIFSESIQGKPLGDIMERIVSGLEYLRYLEEEDDASYLNRMQNLTELYTSASIYSSKRPNDIMGYLNKIALQSSSDKEMPDGATTLMTIHSSKGLEFPVVFMACADDGSLPSAMALKDRGEDAEEERRLCYVGMTRAKKKLYMTHPTTRPKRSSNGFLTNVPAKPSRFFAEAGLKVTKG